MSKKTYFKRATVIAVASLVLSLFSSVPSAQAAIAAADVSLTPTVGSASTATSDSSTAGSVRVRFLSTATNVGGGNGDSVLVTVTLKSSPTGASNTSVAPKLLLSDTGTAGTSAIVDTDQTTIRSRPINTSTAANSATIAANPDDARANFIQYSSDTSADNWSNANYAVYLDTTGGGVLTAGTYVVTVTATPYSHGALTAAARVSTDVNIVVGALSSAALAAVPGNSTAVLYAGSTFAANNTVDSSVAAVATASATAAAVIRVILKNAANTTGARESVTVTTTLGTVGTGGSGAYGRSVTLAYSTTSLDIDVRPDGNAGVATISISTPSVTFAPKQMTFYAAAPSKLVITTATPLLRIGSNDDAVRVTATDVNGNLFAGTLYSYATTTAAQAIAGTARTSATTCSYDAGDQRHECSITGTTAGTASITISNYPSAEAATAAANGAEVSGTATVVVSAAVAASVKVEFDKASYAPGERARIYVTPLDSTGKAMQVNTYTNLLAAGGITTASALTFAGTTTTADSLTAVTITTKSNSSSTSGAKAGSMEYTVFMPVSGGTVTITATGGTGLPMAGRVATTATATVTDSGAAALAAVSALATTVASLKTLITTLTNLVLKIQKKVKA